MNNVTFWRADLYNVICGKENIIKLAQETLLTHADKFKDDYKKLYQLAIDNEIFEPILDVLNVDRTRTFRTYDSFPFHPPLNIEHDLSDWVLYEYVGYEKFVETSFINTFVIISVEQLKEVSKPFVTVDNQNYFFENRNWIKGSITGDIDRFFEQNLSLELYIEFLDFMNRGFVGKDGIRRTFGSKACEGTKDSFCKLTNFFKQYPNGILVFQDKYPPRR
jgi:hypothetical protein